MGREVVRVPPNWDHPKGRTMYDQHIDDAFADWLAQFDRVRAGDMDPYDRAAYPNGLRDWLVDNTPPDPAMHRPWKDEDATWFQLWETVSEGSPVSPPFETKEELIQYLAKHGDYWDQERAIRGGFSSPPGALNPAWGIERARAFVEAGWAPSMMIAGGVLLESKDIPLAASKSKSVK